MTILSTIMGVESSGGHNVTQGNIGDRNNQTGDLAQGYFQITGGTWAQFGGLNTGYTQANQAPYATQLQIAQNIPVSRWGPDTQAALSAAGYSTTRGQTLGQLMAANGETPASGNPSPLGTSVTQNPSGTSSTTSSAAQGAPIQTALQPEEQSFITSAITGIENAFGGGLTKAITAAETAMGNYLGGLQNWFIRAAVILLGVILVGIALVVLMWDHGGSQVAQTATRVVAA